MSALADAIAAGADAVTDRYLAIHGLTPRTKVLAVAWATVDLERVVEELGLSDEDRVSDDILGASGVGIARDQYQDLILEPTTEGRLAACLARNDEGICALYIPADEPLSFTRSTALGQPGSLRKSGPRYGPFIIEVSGS